MTKFVSKTPIVALSGFSFGSGIDVPKVAEGVQFTGEEPYPEGVCNGPDGFYYKRDDGMIQVIEVGYWLIPPFKGMLSPEEVGEMFE